MNFGNTNSSNANRGTFGNQSYLYDVFNPNNEPFNIDMNTVRADFSSNNENGGDLVSPHSHSNPVALSGNNGSHLAQSRPSNVAPVLCLPEVFMPSFCLEGVAHFERRYIPFHTTRSFDLGGYRDSGYYTSSDFAARESYDTSLYNDGISRSSDAIQSYPTAGVPPNTTQHLYSQVSPNDFTTPSYLSVQSSSTQMYKTDSGFTEMYYGQGGDLVSPHSHSNPVALSGNNGSHLAQSRPSNVAPVLCLPEVFMPSFCLEGVAHFERRNIPFYTSRSFDLGGYRDSGYYTSSDFAARESYDTSLYNDGISRSSDAIQSYPTAGVPPNTTQHLYSQVSPNDFTTPSYLSVQSSSYQMYKTDSGFTEMYYGQAASSLEFPSLSGNSTNTFSGSSTDEAAINSMMMNIPEPYSYDAILNGLAVANSTSQYSSNNSASNPFLEENSFGGYLPNTSHYLQPNEQGLEDSYEPQARREISLSESIQACSNLYRESVRQLFSLTDGDPDDMITQYTNNLTACSQSPQDNVAQITSTVSNLYNNEVNVYRHKGAQFCKFCYKNREPEFIFKSHQLKDAEGIIQCPVLRRYVCTICGISGDFAHTLKYCPLNNNNSLVHNRSVSHSTPKSTSTALPPFSYFHNSRDLRFEEANDDSLISSHQLPSEYLQPFTETAMEEQLVDKWESTTGNNFPQLTEENGSQRFACTSSFTNLSKRKKSKICKFCLKNRRTADVYSSHNLKTANGVVECPFLRAFLCDICGATGDTAHTRKYCPYNTYEDFIQKLTNL